MDRSGGKSQKKNSLLAIKGCDLEAKAPVITVHSHDGRVVQVRDQASCHLAARLLHQVTPLREEILPLPGGRHQPRLTERGPGREPADQYRTAEPRRATERCRSGLLADVKVALLLGQVPTDRRVSRVRLVGSIQEVT